MALPTRHAPELTAGGGCRLKDLVKRFLPAGLYRPILVVWRRFRRGPRRGAGLAGLRPYSDIWGLDRGTPIEVHYIQEFLAAHAGNIRGHTLETGEPRYSRRYGGDGVSRVDVLNLLPGNPAATIVGDLVSGRGIPRDEFDCIILTNTLLLVYDVRSALATCFAALRPGGTLLAHFTGLMRRAYNVRSWGPPGWQGEGDYWRFTVSSARRLTEEHFPPENVSVFWKGNVWVAAASLYGLAKEELRAQDLDHADSNFPVFIGVRAIKPGASS